MPMIIRKIRCYFLYNVPVTERMMAVEEAHQFGVTAQLIDQMRQQFEVQPMPIPAFYTNHYRQEHTPFTIQDPNIATTTRIPHETFNQIPFFAVLDLHQDIRVWWEFSLSLQTTGLIKIGIEVTEPRDSTQAYRLGGLHLNPDYKLIETEPIAQLWQHLPHRPPLVTLDELAQAIHTYFFRACGLDVRRFRALRHEIQIPFTAVDVETECRDQEDFVLKNKQALAELVFKPACWEIERASATHADHILEEARIWSVAQDTYVITAYEGAVYVKITTFDTGLPHENSGFYIADEPAVLHTFKVAVGNYHFLRILDDLLDREMDRLKQEVHRYQTMLHTSFEDSDISANNRILREMNEFVIQVTNLEFDLIELMEELNNPDKLIDEEWHIVLLSKLNTAFGVKAWHDGLHMRVNNLRELIQTVENTYQRLLDLSMTRNLFNLTYEAKVAEDREKFVGLIFGAFAIAELLGLFIDLLFNDTHPMVVRIATWLQISPNQSHILSTAGVALFISIVLIIILRYLYRTDPPKHP